MTRAMEIRSSSWNEDEWSFEAVVSTGAIVRRRGWLGDEWDEELIVDPKSIDLGDLNTGAPVLDTHRGSGSVRSALGTHDRAWVEKGLLIAKMRLSQRTDPVTGKRELEGLAHDIRTGIVSKVSSGYQPLEVREQKRSGEVPLVQVTRWKPFETSMCLIPLDGGGRLRAETDAPQFTCAVLRAEDSNDMDPKNAPVAPPAPAAPVVDAADIERRAFAAATTRALEIRDAGQRFGMDERALNEIIADPTVTVDQAKVRIFDFRAKEEKPTDGKRIEMGRAGEDKLGELIGSALTARSFIGIEQRRIDLHNERAKSDGLDVLARPKDDDAIKYGRKRLIDIADDFLRSRNIDTKRMTPNEIAGHALGYRSGGGALATTADFSAILGNVANKMLWLGYAEVTSPWRELIGRRIDRPDFKQFSIFRRSAAPDLEVVNEHGEIKRASYNVPTALVGQLATAGIEVGFTRQMLINDDLDAFNQQSLGLGDAAMRFEDDTVITTLLHDNPTLNDSVAVFDAARGNLSSDGGAPDLPAINEVARLFAKMTETVKKAGNNAGTTTRKIHQDVGGFLGAFTEAVSINQILRPENYNPTTAAVGLPDYLRGLNAYREARLAIESASPDVWYGFSANRKAIAYGYLSGENGPRLSQFAATGTDGVVFQLLHDWYGAWADPYAMVRVPKS